MNGLQHRGFSLTKIFPSPKKLERSANFFFIFTILANARTVKLSHSLPENKQRFISETSHTTLIAIEKVVNPTPNNVTLGKRKAKESWKISKRFFFKLEKIGKNFKDLIF